MCVFQLYIYIYRWRWWTSIICFEWFTATSNHQRAIHCAEAAFTGFAVQEAILFVNRSMRQRGLPVQNPVPARVWWSKSSTDDKIWQVVSFCSVWTNLFLDPPRPRTLLIDNWDEAAESLQDIAWSSWSHQHPNHHQNHIISPSKRKNRHMLVDTVLRLVPFSKHFATQQADNINPNTWPKIHGWHVGNMIATSISQARSAAGFGSGCRAQLLTFPWGQGAVMGGKWRRELAVATSN